MTKSIFLALLLMSVGYSGAASAFESTYRSGPQGVQYRDLQPGEGKPAETGDVVTMHFVAWLAEGEQRGREIYNSRSDANPVSFVVGTEYVMPGWNDGILGMQSGGRRLLLVPPGRAFGNKQVDSTVPPGSSLMFVIELLSVKPPEK